MVDASGLRGRGGAGYPAGLKWRAVFQQAASEKYVVANADEGDPGAYIDRFVLEDNPHGVIEAMAIAGYAVGARRGHIYLRAEYPNARDRLGTAIEEARLARHPRRIELAEYAECHLAPRPGTNIPLLNAMACTIVQEGLCDEEFLAARVAGVEAYLESIQRWTPERAAAETAVDAGLIRQAVRLYGSHTPSMSVHGLGLTEHTQGTETVMALINLALLTGNLGKPGSGINPLRSRKACRKSGSI